MMMQRLRRCSSSRLSKCLLITLLVHIALVALFPLWMTDYNYNARWKPLQRRIGCWVVNHISHRCFSWTPRCRFCQDHWHSPNWLQLGQDTPSCCKEKIKALIFHSIDLLEASGLTWWIDYGTLIGSLRYGELNPWEDDADIGILAEGNDTEARLRNVLKLFDQKYGHSTRMINHDLYHTTYANTNDNNIDFAIFHQQKTNDTDSIQINNRDRDESQHFSLDLLLPLKKNCLLYGRRVPCPNDPVKYLKTYYPGSLLKIRFKMCKTRLGGQCTRLEEEKRMQDTIRDLHFHNFSSFYEDLPLP